MAIHRILGLQNKGKSLYGTMLCLKDFFKGRIIYSNTPLAIPHYLINRAWFLNLIKSKKVVTNATLFLDEYWIWIDARSSQYKANKYASYILLQTSKADLNVVTTAQTDKQDDKRLRDNAHFVTTCERVIKKDGRYKVVISEKRDLGEQINKILYIRARTDKRGELDMYYWKTEYLKAQPFFNLFNTYKRVVAPEL